MMWFKAKLDSIFNAECLKLFSMSSNEFNKESFKL